MSSEEPETHISFNFDISDVAEQLASDLRSRMDSLPSVEVRKNDGFEV